MAEELIADITHRMKKGREQYGHGLVPSMDTRKWGTEEDCWREMAREEFLDSIIYILVDYIRQLVPSHLEFLKERECNDEILMYLTHPELIKSEYHRRTVATIEQLIQESRLRSRQRQLLCPPHDVSQSHSPRSANLRRSHLRPEASQSHSDCYQDTVDAKKQR